MERTEDILGSDNEEAIVRQLGTLRTLSSDVDRLRVDEEARKIEAIEDVTTWNLEVNKQLADADKRAESAKKWLFDSKREKQSLEREEKMKFELKPPDTKQKAQAEYEGLNRPCRMPGQAIAMPNCLN